MSGSTIVYVNTGDGGTKRCKPVRDDYEIIKKMISEEPCVYEGLSFYRSFVQCMQFNIAASQSKGLRLTQDAGVLRKFCEEAVVYYFAFRFVAMRFVRASEDKAELWPLCIPLQQIDFSYDVCDVHSVVQAPTVFYATQSLQALHERAVMPQIFVYKFQSSLVDTFSPGPLALLCNSYQEMVKVREHNSLVLAENSSIVQYVENSEVDKSVVGGDGGIIRERTTVDFMQADRERVSKNQKISDIVQTRNIIHEQMDEIDTGQNKFIQEQRERFVILPPNTRVCSSAAQNRLSFMSCTDTSSFFHVNAARVFEMPKSTGQNSAHDGDGVRDGKKKRWNEETRSHRDAYSGPRPPTSQGVQDSEPPGVRKYRIAMEDMLTTIASVLADPKLDEKLKTMSDERASNHRAQAALYKSKGFTGASSISLQEIRACTTVSCKVSMQAKQLLYTCKSYNIGPTPSQSSVDSTRKKRKKHNKTHTSLEHENPDASRKRRKERRDATRANNTRGVHGVKQRLDSV